MLDAFLGAASNLLDITLIGWMVIGITFGMIMGAIPGLGAAIAMSVSIPLTFVMPPVNAIVFMVAIFKGSMLGNSFPAILINTPGEPSSAATCLDGYPLSKKGMSKKAIQMAIYGSSLADIITDILLIFGTVALATFVLRFGHPELFWVMIFSLIITGSIVGKSIWKGLLAVFIGLLLGTVGADPISGAARFALIPILGKVEGLELIAVALAMFAVPEIMDNLIKSKANKKSIDETYVPSVYGPSLNFTDIKDSAKGFLIGTATGMFAGLVPGLGTTAASFLGYGIAKESYKGKSKSGKFGEGALPGVAAADAANSAVSGANLLPLFTLGIPGSAGAALILVVFMLQGIVPGPGLFERHGEVIYLVLLAFIVCNFINVILGHILLYPLIKFFKSDPIVIFPIVLIICMTGVYVVNNRLTDVGIFIVLGVLFFFMVRGGIPAPPMLIAFILSRGVEFNFRTSMIRSSGDFSIFINSSISQVIIALTVLAFLAVVIQRRRSGEYK